LHEDESTVAPYAEVPKSKARSIKLKPQHRVSASHKKRVEPVVHEIADNQSSLMQSNKSRNELADYLQIPSSTKIQQFLNGMDGCQQLLKKGKQVSKSRVGYLIPH
jgi:predicted GTPase